MELVALTSFVILIVSWLALPTGERQVARERLSVGAAQVSSVKA